MEKSEKFNLEKGFKLSAMYEESLPPRPS